jgi:superfamily II DNA or RNA helicase
VVVKYGYPKYMPAPYSIYASDFGDRMLQVFKADKFARYHADTREYEISPELFEKVKHIEPIYEYNSLPKQKLYTPFEYKTDYPYQYQDNAVEFMRTTDFALINFSQGLGKSRTTMRILEDRGIKRALIITGVSNLQEEWLKDAQKHKAMDGQSFADFLNMRIVAGNPDAPVKKRLEYLKEAHEGEEQFTDLIGIESLRGQQIVEAINNLKYQAIVIDECQSAKGMKAEQSKGVHEIEYYEGQIRLALSGTPALNDPLEYYSVLRFLQVLYYKSHRDQCARTTFNMYYGVWEKNFWGAMVCTRYKNLDQLKQLIDPVLAYVPKSILGLPKKNRLKVNLTIENPEYEDKLKLYRRGSTAVMKAGYPTIQALAAELQFITSSDLSKKRYIIQRIKRRPLVFSQYTTVLDDVKEYIERQGYEVLYYHGKLSMKQRLAILERWKSGEGDALLLSLNASRYGLNLQETQQAIFLEPPTSPAILEQAEDRLHRIGQSKEVLSELLTAGASDESDWDILIGKATILDMDFSFTEVLQQEALALW